MQSSPGDLSEKPQSIALMVLLKEPVSFQRSKAWVGQSPGLRDRGVG